MRRVRSSLIAAVLTVAVVAAAGCGVTADTTAATIGDETVSVDTVDDLARDVPFDQGTGGAQASESVLPGQAARSALSLALQGAASLEAARLLGLEVDDAARSAGEAEFESQIAQAQTQGQSVPEFGSAAREVYIDLFTGLLLISEHLRSADESALRTVYDSAPSLWERSCYTALLVGEADQAATEALLDGGATEDEVLEQVESAELALQGEDGCFPSGRLNPEFAASAADAPTGEFGEPIVTTVSATGGPVAAFFRLDDSTRLSFEDADDVLSEVVGNPTVWIAALVSDAEVNPRYGSGVEVDGNGQAAVLPPPTPVVPAVAGLSAG